MITRYSVVEGRNIASADNYSRTVTGLKPGTAVIEAGMSINDEWISDTCTVTVLSGTDMVLPEDLSVIEAEAFAGTGAILNARAVGNVETVMDTVKKIWHPGLKLIINTYCKTPEEQQEAYDQIHDYTSKRS